MYEKFEQLLKEYGVTPYRVHKETGISTATLSDWKNGKSQPKKDKIEKICDYFNVPISYFYGDESEEPGYYLNPETAEIAQDIFENKELRKSGHRKEKYMRNTAIYIRVSTDTQARKGDSLGEQPETLKKYIDEQPDLVLYDTYIDDGVSGHKLDRGDFTRLLDDVKAGRVDFIIFTKLDRWFRSLRHYLNTQAILEKHNVAWLAVSQPFYDTSTPQGRAFVAQSMMFAELEAQNDSVHIKDVFNYKYKRGEVLSGKTPLGYSIKDKHLVPNEDAEKAVAVFKHYDKTNNLNSTTLFLEHEYGIVMTTPNLKKSILANTKYIGVFRDNENFCPAIIDRELFDRVQLNLKRNVKSSVKRDYVFFRADSMRALRKDYVWIYTPNPSNQPDIFLSRLSLQAGIPVKAV